MKKIRSFYTNNYGKAKKILNWIIYFIFITYIFYLILQSKTVSGKICIAILGLIVLSIILLFEWLKSLYEKMIYALTFNCDISEALYYQELLKKYDFFNGFNQSLILFNSLLLLDQGLYHECLTHLKKHRNFFHSTLDYLLIEYRTTLQCAYFLGDSNLFDDAQKKLKQLKNQANKKNPISPLYSWEENKGLLLFRQQRYRQAQQTLASVSTKTFNPREEAYLLFEKAQIEIALNQPAQANHLFKQILKITNSFHLYTLAKRKEKIHFEKF